jgi:hypothetical protein
MSRISLIGANYAIQLGKFLSNIEHVGDLFFLQYPPNPQGLACKLAVKHESESDEGGQCQATPPGRRR